MKIKIITGVLAFAVLTGVASAASTAALSFGETSLKKNTDVMGYLVYLSSGSLATTYTIDDSFTAASVGTIVSTDTDGTNKGSASTASFQIEAGTYSNGDAFAFVASYTTGGKTYWNISSTVQTLSGLDDSDPRVNPAEWNSFAVNTAIASVPGKASGGSGWTAAAVPEPSTAMLALAGLALLIKRRKA